MSEMRERLAKAIYEGGNPDRRPAESWDELPIDWRDAFFSVADVALAAMREPTEEMLSAADSAIPQAETDEHGVRMMGREVALEAWRAMIDAACSPLSPDNTRLTQD